MREVFTAADPTVDSHDESAPSLLRILQRPKTQRVFVHDFSAVNVPTLDKEVGETGNLYAERALVMAQRGDLVVVADAVDPAYLAYLDELELGPGANQVLALNRNPRPKDDAPVRLLDMLAYGDACLNRVAERLNGSGATRLSPYCAETAARRIQQRLQKRLAREVAIDGGSCESVDLANRKDLVRCHAQVLNVPVAQGEVVSLSSSDCAGTTLRLADAVARHRSRTGGVFVRGTWSVQGLDTLKITDALELGGLKSWLAQRRHVDSYLVESLVPLSASPNVQLWIDDDGGCDLLETTNQRLDRSAHFGNTYPHRSSVQEELNTSAVRLARWLSANGYRGPLGIDFLETINADSGQPIHMLAEVNGRINGATYTLALWARVNQVRELLGRPPITVWISNARIATRCLGFAELQDTIADLLYSHESSGGILPYNTGLLPHGIAAVAVFGASVAETQAIETEFTERVRDV